MQNNFIIIISLSQRSFEYLKNLKENNLIPIEIILLKKNSKNPIYNKLKAKKFFFPEKKIKIFNTDNIDNDVARYLKKNKVLNIVYSGYEGKIVKNKYILKSKNIIHSHSGKLPNYKGSTTIYYSILNEKKIFCSTIILNSHIDGGNILFQKKYPIPKNIFDIDGNYDNEIRAKNLIYTLKNYRS